MTDSDGGTNAELEEAIRKDPENQQAYLVYADWLQSRGDPRGELISIQHARLTADTPELRKREAELLERHPFLRGLERLLDEGGGLTVQWHRGFLRSVRVARDAWDSDLDVAATLKAVLALPVARLVEEVVVGLCGESGEWDLQPAIDALVEGGRPQTLKELFLGDFEHPDQSDMSATQVGDLSRLYRVFPGLRSLKLRGGSVTLGEIELPELRDFTVETGGLSLASMRSIGAARWPRLEQLTIWFGDENYGAECGIADLEPVLAGTGLGKLRRLGLVNSAFLTGNIDALAGAAVLRRLERLDLSKGTLVDADAEAIVRNAAAFQHLTLDVSDNFLTERGLFLVRKAAKEVVATSMNDVGLDDYRFVAVGE